MWRLFRGQPSWLDDAFVCSARVQKNQPWSEKNKKAAWYQRSVWKYSRPISNWKNPFNLCELFQWDLACKVCKTHTHTRTSESSIGPVIGTMWLWHSVYVTFQAGGHQNLRRHTSFTHTATAGLCGSVLTKTRFFSPSAWTPFVEEVEFRTAAPSKPLTRRAQSSETLFTQAFIMN